MAHRTWRVLLLAIIALITWHSVVTQSHVHASAVGTSLLHDRAAPASNQYPSDDPATCPSCRELATSGDYLPSAPIVVHAIARPAQPLLRDRSQRSIEQARWLAWRSRAPPVLSDR